MNNEQKNEVLKALAYGRTPEKIAEAEDVELTEVENIQSEHADEIAEMREQYRKAGFIND